MSLRKNCALVSYTRAGRNISVYNRLGRNISFLKSQSVKTGSASILRECLY